MVVSGGLKSCTTEPDVATIDQHSPPDNYRLNLIDTPGFDDTIEADFAILKKIATCLEKLYVVLEVYRTRHKLTGYQLQERGETWRHYLSSRHNYSSLRRPSESAPRNISNDLWGRIP